MVTLGQLLSFSPSYLTELWLWGKIRRGNVIYTTFGTGEKAGYKLGNNICMQISVLLPLLIQLNQARLEEKYIFSVDR